MTNQSVTDKHPEKLLPMWARSATVTESRAPAAPRGTVLHCSSPTACCNLGTCGRHALQGELQRGKIYIVIPLLLVDGRC